MLSPLTPPKGTAVLSPSIKAKNMRHTNVISVLLVIAALSVGPAGAQIRVVTTLPAYASLAEEIGGDRVIAEAISRGDEDAHFVKPKPSFALMLKRADLFVTTGLDLEIWAPLLIDKSGNRRIREGAPGWVSASTGVPLLGVPEVVDRSAGDVHVYGNPHIFTSPLNAKLIANNIAVGLERVDPDGAAAYTTGLATFEHRIDVALYGETLVDLLGAETLDPLTRSGRLLPFLEGQTYEGRPLIEHLGGWLGAAQAFRGKRILAYHKNWIYFCDLFNLEIAGYVEPKPGIPPSPRHVHKLMDTVERENISVLLAASYFGKDKINRIAERLGTKTVLVPLGPTKGSGDGPASYIELVDLWIGGLRAMLSP